MRCDAWTRHCLVDFRVRVAESVVLIQCIRMQSRSLNQKFWNEFGEFWNEFGDLCHMENAWLLLFIKPLRTLDRLTASNRFFSKRWASVSVSDFESIFIWRHLSEDLPFTSAVKMHCQTDARYRCRCDHCNSDTVAIWRFSNEEAALFVAKTNWVNRVVNFQIWTLVQQFTNLFTSNLRVLMGIQWIQST